MFLSSSILTKCKLDAFGVFPGSQAFCSGGEDRHGPYRDKAVGIGRRGALLPSPIQIM